MNPAGVVELNDVAELCRQNVDDFEQLWPKGRPEFDVDSSLVERARINLMKVHEVALGELALAS